LGLVPLVLAKLLGVVGARGVAFSGAVVECAFGVFVLEPELELFLALGVFQALGRDALRGALNGFARF